MNADKIWSLIETIKDDRIYKVNDRYVVTRNSYDKSYGYNHTKESYNTYEDAMAQERGKK